MISYQLKFSRFYKSLKEVSSLFPDFKSGVLNGLDTTLSIATSLLESGAEGTQHEEVIDEIRRDVSIYTSRIEKLSLALDECVSRVDSLAKKVKSKEADCEEVDNCIAEFMKWFDLKRDFYNCYKKAQHKWQVTEALLIHIFKPCE